MKVVEVNNLKEQPTGLRYEDLKLNTTFSMFGDSRVRIRTHEGHILFFPRDGEVTIREYQCPDLFEGNRVILIDLELRWCKKEVL